MARFKDISERRFGRLVVLGPTDKRIRGYCIWECRCDCGSTHFAPTNALQCGHTKSCGCLRATDLANQRFGRLLAVRKTIQRNAKKVVWECLCDCGKTKQVISTSLIAGITRSCGCLRRESSVARFTTHKLGGTPTHKSWSHMLYRCTNPRSKKWARYGGRGIKVCDRWRKFENFLADMGERPSGSTLDRYPNNDGNYEPGNCRWATQHMQQNNRSTNRLLTSHGKTMNLKQWAQHLGLNQSTLHIRLNKNWPIEKVLSKTRYTRQPGTPNARRHKRVILPQQTD